MAIPGKKKKCPPEGAPAWMLTYGDMVTLLLTFFVMLYTTATVDGYKLKIVLSAFSGLGMLEGGNTLQIGQMAELGNTIESFPSLQRGRSLDKARKRALSIFQPEVESKMVRVTENERGLVISLAADSFFEVASAEVDIEASRKNPREGFGSSLQPAGGSEVSLGGAYRFPTHRPRGRVGD